MSAVVVNEVRRGFYLDSVALMQLSAELAALAAVEDAVAMTGTPSNLQIMREAGLLAPPGAAAGPNDLVVAVRAAGAAEAEEALSHARRALAREVAPEEVGEWRPRTLDGAVDRMRDANLVLVSTPGAHAEREARRALDRGLNVMLFSDNVPLEAERVLKDRAHALGLLVMGPDCGTAYIAGAPIAFANVVPRGRIGRHCGVGDRASGGRGAAGTGRGGNLARNRGGRARPFGCRRRCEHAGRHRPSRLGRRNRSPDPRLQAARPADRARGLRADRGVGQALHRGGVRGGRDRAPAGRAGPGPDAQGRGRARDGMPDRARLPTPRRLPGAKWERLGPGRHALHGLFCGGTLATEAHAVLAAAGIGAVSGPASRAPPGANAPHRVIDLGADEFTVGRPHPMIDPALRAAKLREALADRQVAVVLLDVMLGLGAHPDPARPVRDAVRDADGDRPAVVASVCGTADDPQDAERQAAMLTGAGVAVAPSNADAASVAAAILGHRR